MFQIEECPGTQHDAGQLDLICLSHLRWDFVYQRPQHLMSRFARDRRVFFVEEPVRDDGPDRMEVRTTPQGVSVATPHLPHGVDGDAMDEAQRELLDRFLYERGIRDFALWYYTPMALDFSRHLRPRLVVYDSMDELSLFAFAPPALLERERELFRRTDLVFTGGSSLYEAKRGRHPNVHCFPSSIDADHFRSARGGKEDPEDQAAVPHPRLGFFGVIDERMDRELLAAVADLRPDWHFVMIGPVVKIGPAELPERPNLHYLGLKPYVELPRYIAGWDVAIMPWARNESTRFISPTKTLEYLASGKPVISTPIADVARTYGETGLVRIAETPGAWAREIDALLARTPAEQAAWLREVEALLARTSWERTWQEMRARMDVVLAAGAGDAVPPAA